MLGLWFGYDDPRGPPRREMLKEMPKTLNVEIYSACQSHSHCGFRTASEGEDIVYAANYFVISKEESQDNVWKEKHYRVEWHIPDHTTTVELVLCFISGSVAKVEPIFKDDTLKIGSTFATLPL